MWFYGMEAYTDFAGVYDIFMDETPYGEWAEYIIAVLKEYGITPADRPASDMNGEKRAAGEAKSAGEQELLAAERGTVLDLGCGTGTLTELLADAGYDMIGIDNSQEMLNLALAKRERSGKDILYLHQDMREFELYGTVGAVVSVCDSLNYLLEEEDICSAFRLVNNYLYPGGVFIFDFNTVYKYETVIGDAVIAENREDCSFIWDNYYDGENGINEYDLTIFIRETGQMQENGSGQMEEAGKSYEPEGLFRRFTETHYQRGYTLETMTGLVKRSGLQFVKAIDADTHGAVRKESERIYVIAREAGKEAANE